MASSQESRIPVYDASEGLEPTKENADGAGATVNMAAVAQVEALTSTRSTSPMRSSSPHRSTRKFFQDKVHEAVRRARYGQWDFDFSATSAAHSAEDTTSPPLPLTVPPWGPVSAKEIFTGILRPNRNDSDWKYSSSGNGGSPRTPGSLRTYVET